MSISLVRDHDVTICTRHASGESAAQLGIPLRVAISLSETIRLPATTPEPVGLSAVKLTEHSKREISSPLASDGISDQRDHVFDGLPTDLRFEAIVLLSDGATLLLAPTERLSPSLSTPPVAVAAVKLPRTAIHRECSSSFASPSSPDPPHTVSVTSVRPPTSRNSSCSTPEGKHSLLGSWNVDEIFPGLSLVSLLPRRSAFRCWQVGHRFECDPGC